MLFLHVVNHLPLAVAAWRHTGPAGRSQHQERTAMPPELTAPAILLDQTDVARLNEQLEQRVAERTRALEAANEELRMEIARRERVEEDLRRQKEILQTIIDHVPLILKFVDKDGSI